MFDRRVTRIVTPGTLIDEKFMDPYENNFLLAVQPVGSDKIVAAVGDRPVELKNDVLDPELRSVLVGLAWLDLSTGDFFTQAISLMTLPSALARIGAKEVIVSDALNDAVFSNVASIIDHERLLLTSHSGKHAELPMSAWTSMLETPVPKAVEAAFTHEETAAGSMLLTYVAEKLQGLHLKLQPPQRRLELDTMSIDKNSLKGLEILATFREGTPGGKGTLLHTVRRTVTRSGSRLLKDWLSSPSASMSVINARLDLVSILLHNTALREAIVKELRRTSDCQRLVQQFSMGRGDADDLVSLFKTIEITESVAGMLAEVISSNCGDEPGHAAGGLLWLMYRRLSLEGPRALATRISTAIDEEGLMQSHRKEESESQGYISAAQEVLQKEGSAADYDEMPRAIRAKIALQGPSELEASDEDTWIMRKTFVPRISGPRSDMVDVDFFAERALLSRTYTIACPSCARRKITLR